jgi:ABC-type nitrate/sulfonate/bicarbonate transport system substrate-binding protein
MRSYAPTRRDALRAAVRSGIAFFTLSASMKILGSSASAQTAQKIMMGTSPVTALIGSYIGQVDFFNEEGLDIEWTRFVTGPPMMQAMAAGNIVVGTRDWRTPSWPSLAACHYKPSTSELAARRDIRSSGSW